MTHYMIMWQTRNNLSNDEYVIRVIQIMFSMEKTWFFFFFNDDILVTVRTVSLSPDTRMILNRDNVIVYLINIVGLQVNDVEDGKYSKRLKDVPWYLVLRFHCEVLKQLLNYHYNIICMAWKQLFVKETCWSFVNRDSILTSPVIKFNLINFISYKINKTCDTWKKKN